MDAVLLRLKPASLAAESGEFESGTSFITLRNRFRAVGCLYLTDRIMRVHVAADEECFEALLRLVVHVVSERRLHQLREPCVYPRSPSTRAIVPDCIRDGGSTHSRAMSAMPLVRRLSP